MVNELEIITSLDQSIETNGSEDEILQRVEQLVQQAIKDKDVEAALNIPRQIILVQKISGLALAKAIYMIKQSWDVFEMDEPFEDVAFAYFGKHKSTISRYEKIWRMLEGSNVPDKYKEDVKQIGIQSQIPIANHLDAGYEIEDDDWKELIGEPDFHSVSAKLRELKGKEPRPQALSIWMERDGTLKCSKGGGIYYLGWLDIDEKNEIVQQAIERIRKHTGVLAK